MSVSVAEEPMQLRVDLPVVLAAGQAGQVWPQRDEDGAEPPDHERRAPELVGARWFIGGKTEDKPEYVLSLYWRAIKKMERRAEQPQNLHAAS